MPAGNTFELIGSTTLASASATGLEVTSISSAYDDLFVICEMLNSVGSGINMRFNTDTGSNYYVDKLKIYGTGTNSRIATTRGSTAANICPDTVSLPTSGTYFPVFVMTVHNYKDTSVKKVFETSVVIDGVRIASADGLVALKIKRHNFQDIADIDNIISLHDIDISNWPLDENDISYVEEKLGYKIR